MDLTSIFQLCSLSAAKRLNPKRRRRPLARRLGSEHLEPRLMFDATADFNAAIAAAQSLYATQQAGEDAAFQTTEQTDFGSLATQADGIGQGLLTDVTTDDQTLQSASDSAAGTMHTQDAASDQTDVTLDQNADDQAEQTIAQAVQDETNTDASDDAQLSSEVSAEQAAAAATLNTNNNGFDNTMSADQAQTLANVTDDENAYNTTVSNDESQLEQTDAALETATAGQVSDLASSVVSQLGGIAPSVDPSVADSDAGYQAALSQGSDALNAAEQQAENDITNGDAAADAIAAPLFQAAADQFNTDTQGAQNNYNTNVQSAQDQYNQAILPFQQQLTNTLASDQQTYNTQVQTATNTFNGDTAIPGGPFEPGKHGVFENAFRDARTSTRSFI